MRFNYFMVKKQHNLRKIGKKIRELRKAGNHSQEGFAAVADLGRTYMGRVERGEQNISIQNLIQIAFALDVEVGALIPFLKDLDDPRKEITN